MQKKSKMAGIVSMHQHPLSIYRYLSIPRTPFSKGDLAGRN